MKKRIPNATSGVTPSTTILIAMKLDPHKIDSITIDANTIGFEWCMNPNRSFFIFILLVHR